MQIKELGHVVLMVSDMERSEQFYSDVLGLPVAARMDDPAMLFFTLGKHHDLAISALGDDAPRPARGTTGLNHVAFKVGDSIDDLRDAKSHLEDAGVTVHPVDHGVTK